MVIPAWKGGVHACRLVVEEPFTLLESVQCFVRFSELRQDPGGGGDQIGKQEGYGSRPGHRDPALDHDVRLRPVPLEQVEPAHGKVGKADGVRMLRRFRTLDEGGPMIRRLSESAEMGEAHDQPDAVTDRYWYEASEGLVDPVGGERGEIFRGQLDHLPVLATHEVREPQQTCGENAEFHVLEPPSDLQGPED